MSRTQSRDIAPPDLPGYRFIRHLGAGGNAQVYLYEQDLPHREVAVKVLKESALSEAARRRFTAEANVTAGLAHRHIVQVFDAKVTDDGRPYIVMPYYPQPNLSVRARRAHLSVAEVLRVGIQIGSAAETSHRHGVLHRDIKPQNILIDSYGEPALTDFGIATTTGGDGPEGLSVPWSPPEILYGTAPGDQRSDVYSLGATLWHLLVGRSPFEQPGGDNTTYALLSRIKSDPVPGTGRADVPDSLERLLRQAMAKDPAARPQTAMELIRGLQSIEQELRLPVTQPILPADGPSAPDPGGDTIARSAGGTGHATAGPGHDRGTELPWGGAAAAGNTWRPGAGYADPRTWASPVEDDATRARAPRRVDPRGFTEEEQETRARGPMRIDPWGGTPAQGTGARQRQFPPDAPEAATLARPRSAPAFFDGSGAAGYGPPENPLSGTDRGLDQTSHTDSGTAADRSRGTGRTGRALVLAGGGAVLAVVAAVAVLMLAHGGGQPSTAPTSAGQATQAGGAQDAVGPDAAAPGTPVVKAHRIDSAQVQFSWTYADPAAGDTYIWQRVGGAAGQASGRVAKPRLAIDLAEGHTICVQVTVRRADGQISPASTACWPPS